VQWTGPWDWYGNWDFDDWVVTTVWGMPPSGGEWYDIEAIYFDINMTHIFLAIVTSVPFYTEWDGVWDVGIQEQRWLFDNNWVRPGDLCFNLNLSKPRVERFGTWSYDYGIDIIHENRDNKYPPNSGNTYMRDNLLGSSLYKTLADSGGQNIQDPGYGYDWYTASWYIDANWKHSNFDPLSVLSSPVLEKMGDEISGVVTNYYQYHFTGEWAGFEENNAETWVIEASIPIRLFKSGDWPPPGGTMGIQWISSCRNDEHISDSGNLVVRIPAYLGDLVWEDLDADGVQDVEEPGVSGVVVHLFDSEFDEIDSVVTDVLGRYGFAGLMPGSYYLGFELPGGYVFSGGDMADEGNDSDADGVSGLTERIDVSPGEFDLSWDAGIHVKKENYPPSKPTISGPLMGHKNTSYVFTVSSFNPDNDQIQYIVNWDDGDKTITEFFDSGASTRQSHRWTDYGEYNIAVYAIDKENGTASNAHTIFIDVVRIDMLIHGYLVDKDGDEIYDVFINLDTGEETMVAVENQTYLIDSDADGKWDHTYHHGIGVLTYYDYLYQKYYKIVFQDYQETPGFGIIPLLTVMACVVLITRKKQRNKCHP
jgi:hypothetical protein